MPPARRCRRAQIRVESTRGQKGLVRVRTVLMSRIPRWRGGFHPRFFCPAHQAVGVKGFDHAQLRRRGRYNQRLERTSGMARLRLSINTACTGNLDGRATGMFQGKNFHVKDGGAAFEWISRFARRGRSARNPD